RRIAIVLANYPNRDGRIGNGVGLDTPAGVIEVLRALHGAGYSIEHAPDDGAALMHLLLNGPTNSTNIPPPPAGGGLRGRGLAPAGAQDSVSDLRGLEDSIPRSRAETPPPESPSHKGRGNIECGLGLADYAEFFASLPQRLQLQITDRWGSPERDPFFT